MVASRSFAVTLLPSHTQDATGMFAIATLGDSIVNLVVDTVEIVAIDWMFVNLGECLMLEHSNQEWLLDAILIQKVLLV